MNEMYFKSIIISDINKHTAHFQEFHKGFNVVTSSDNHVGKSSLLKSLYYTMGAEVDFDNVWDKKNKIYIVEFNLNNKTYKIARFLKRFVVFEDGKMILLTESVSRDLAKKYEDIFAFGIYLPNKRDKRVEIAPPAFTFMPYYIDQDTGWSGLYDSFNNIDQYNKNDRIKSLYYHLKIYNKNTVELMAKKDQKKDEIEELKKEEEKIRITLDSLSNEVQNLLPADTIESLEKSLQIPKEKIARIVSQIGDVRNKIQKLETALHQHEHQLQIIEEYNQMKLKISGEEKTSIHTCPQCGYTFDEELYDIVRSNYNIQNEDYMRQQIQLIIDSIIEELDVWKTKYLSLMNKLEQQEQAFDDSQDSYNVYVRQRGLKDSLEHFTNELGENTYQQSLRTEDIKSINKELKKLPNKKEIEEKYVEYVRSNIIKLDAWDLAYEDNIKLLTPIKAQGTLENKIILAQFIALFQTMNTLKCNTIRFPFVIDSPRAKEASHASSKDIIKMISEMKMIPQIILATMDYDEFDTDMKRKAYITVLKEKRKLLNKEVYNSYQKEIEEMWELLKMV